MQAKELQLKRVGADLAVQIERDNHFDPYETSQVCLEALDMTAYKFQIEHNDIEYDYFKSRILEQLDRVRGVIVEAKP